MSFDKTKAMRNAERFLSQGKIRAAITEYKRVVENDPKDFSTLNVLGDLYAKDNERSEAVACFKQVAEHYSKQGFAQKAIAIYNKISRLEPNSLEVSAKLAQLYQMKGSLAEARLHYEALADQYQKKGQNTEALEIWKQVAQMDSNNTEVYLKIAEFCLKNDQQDEAAKALTGAGLRFSKLNQLDSALSAFSRALEIEQHELPALNGFVKTKIKLGCADEAAQKLEEILVAQPYNREILYMLVDCYIDSNNAAEAEKTVIRLVEQEPANFPKFLELVELYIKNDNLNAAMRILSMSSEHLLVGGKSEDFLKWTNEILARNPEHLDALRLLVRYYGWQRDETELKNSLERLAETAQLQESIDDERYALSQLVMIVPHEVSYAQRLQEINHGYDGEMPAPLIEIAGVENSAQELSAGGKIETFGDYAVFENSHGTVGHEVSEDYAALEGDTGRSETSDPLAYDEGSFSQSDSWNGYADFEVIGESFQITSGEFSSQSDGADKTLFSANGQSDHALSASEELRLSQEIESIEFYISQGYRDLADKTLGGLEAEFGTRPEFASLREKLDDPDGDGAGEEAPQIEILEAENLSDMPHEITIETSSDQNSYDFLSDFRSDLGLEEAEPAEEEGDYDTHYQTAIVYKEMGLMEDSIRAFQDAVNLVRPDDGTRRFFHCCNLLGLCFMESGMPNLALMWYRRALETPNLNEEEKQALLYETGIAYEKGGEKPKALEYFEQIYAVNVDYRDVSTRLESLRSECLVMR